MSDPPDIPRFSPAPLLRNRHVQSILASVHPRKAVVRRRAQGFSAAAVEQILDCGEGVRLQCFVSETSATPLGSVMLLHGWEGSAESTYNLSLGQRLWSAGYDVFRLNFRDHGRTHHLNRGIFHSCRLREVVGAVHAVAGSARTRPLFLAGYSLGGNFALRSAVETAGPGQPLGHVVAINPTVAPRSVMLALEDGPSFYHDHFMKKWRRSLAAKQSAFPELYDFSECLRLDSLRELTRYLVMRYTDLGSLDNYLDGYSIAGERLAGLRVPTTIVTSADDPIIPVEDFETMARPDCLTFEVQSCGGHCGYVESLSMKSWIEDRVLSVLKQARTV